MQYTPSAQLMQCRYRYQFYVACCAVITAIDVADSLNASKDDIVIIIISSSIGSRSGFVPNVSVANQIASVIIRVLNVSSLNLHALCHVNVA